MLPKGDAVHIEVFGVQPVPHHKLFAKSLMAVSVSASPAPGVKVPTIVTGWPTIALLVGLMPLPVMVTVGGAAETLTVIDISGVLGNGTMPEPNAGLFGFPE